MADVFACYFWLIDVSELCVILARDLWRMEFDLIKFAI